MLTYHFFILRNVSYLTSLLINPLATNKSNSNHLDIEFYIKQKKQFQYANYLGTLV